MSNRMSNAATQNEVMPKLLLNCRDAAAALSVSTKTLWLISAPRGPLPTVRFGRTVRYSPADLEAFIEQARNQ